MRIRAERDDLADVLTRAGRAVGTRSALPILQGVLCEVTGGTLRVTGTDTEITIQTSLEVEVLEEGRTVVPAKLVAEAVRKLPPGAVAFGAKEGEVEITGNGPRFNLREFDANDFPDVGGKADVGGVEMDGDALTAALNQVLLLQPTKAGPRSPVCSSKPRAITCAWSPRTRIGWQSVTCPVLPASRPL